MLNFARSIILSLGVRKSSVSRVVPLWASSMLAKPRLYHTTRTLYKEDGDSTGGDSFDNSIDLDFKWNGDYSINNKKYIEDSVELSLFELKLLDASDPRYEELINKHYYHMTIECQGISDGLYSYTPFHNMMKIVTRQLDADIKNIKGRTRHTFSKTYFKPGFKRERTRFFYTVNQHHVVYELGISKLCKGACDILLNTLAHFKPEYLEINIRRYEEIKVDYSTEEKFGLIKVHRDRILADIPGEEIY